MVSKYRKHYLFASDFDKTLTFNDTGYVLSEVLGISVTEFERKAKGMAKLNLVQQGAELSYLLLHDPEFHTRVRRDHLVRGGQAHSPLGKHQADLRDFGSADRGIPF
jgi:hypothetical protein